VLGVSEIRSQEGFGRLALNFDPPDLGLLIARIIGVSHQQRV
jgi:hypothetical protein